MSRVPDGPPFLIADLGDGMHTAIGEERVRELLDQILRAYAQSDAPPSGYEREDPETGDRLPAGVEGFRVDTR